MDDQKQVEEQLYGAGLNFLDAVRLLVQYGPLLGRLQAIASAATSYDRAKEIIGTAKWMASQTKGTTLDDDAVAHLEAVLNSPEGKAVFDWAAGLFAGVQK